ncbi:unnamed protein product [Brassica oleracea var. botrytis]
MIESELMVKFHKFFRQRFRSSLSSLRLLYVSVAYEIKSISQNA